MLLIRVQGDANIAAVAESHVPSGFHVHNGDFFGQINAKTNRVLRSDHNRLLGRNVLTFFGRLNLLKILVNAIYANGPRDNKGINIQRKSV